jgi:hypothetical protein
VLADLGMLPSLRPSVAMVVIAGAGWRALVVALALLVIVELGRRGWAAVKRR